MEHGIRLSFVKTSEIPGGGGVEPPHPPTPPHLYATVSRNYVHCAIGKHSYPLLVAGTREQQGWRPKDVVLLQRVLVVSGG
jgi:hypothetical protein